MIRARREINLLRIYKHTVQNKVLLLESILLCSFYKTLHVHLSYSWVLHYPQGKDMHSDHAVRTSKYPHKAHRQMSSVLRNKPKGDRIPRIYRLKTNKQRAESDPQTKDLQFKDRGQNQTHKLDQNYLKCKYELTSFINSKTPPTFQCAMFLFIRKKYMKLQLETAPPFQRSHDVGKKCQAVSLCMPLICQRLGNFHGVFLDLSTGHNSYKAQGQTEAVSKNMEDVEQSQGHGNIPHCHNVWIHLLILQKSNGIIPTSQFKHSTT